MPVEGPEELAEALGLLLTQGDIRQDVQGTLAGHIPPAERQYFRHCGLPSPCVAEPHLRDIPAT